MFMNKYEGIIKTQPVELTRTGRMYLRMLKDKSQFQFDLLNSLDLINPLIYTVQEQLDDLNETLTKQYWHQSKEELQQAANELERTAIFRRIDLTVQEVLKERMTELLNLNQMEIAQEAAKTYPTVKVPFEEE